MRNVLLVKSSALTSLCCSIITASGVLLSTGSAFAANYACKPQVDSITQVLREKSFDCENFGNQEACHQICEVVSSASSSLNPGSGAARCTQDEIRRVQAETERATLERVRMDLNAEGTARASAVGATPEDCLNNARIRAQGATSSVIAQCNDKSRYFKNCQIAGTRVINNPSEIAPLRQVSHIEVRQDRETADQCKSKATAAAASSAIESCRNATGVDCALVSGPTAATLSTREEKRYGFFGPTDKFFVCESAAEAKPSSNARYQCSVEIYARNQF